MQECAEVLLVGEDESADGKVEFRFEKIPIDHVDVAIVRPENSSSGCPKSGFMLLRCRISAHTQRKTAFDSPGLCGLRRAELLNSAKREARNFYVWDSEDAAKAFFTEELSRTSKRSLGCAP